MLWSLIKILAFVAAVTALTFGGVALMEASGGAVIKVAGYQIPLSPLEMVVGLILLVLLVWVALKLIGLLAATFRFLNGDETAISRYFTRNRERRGFDALSEGMMALASGEGHLAMAKAAKAERYLERPELTTLLTAQAAEMAGDTRKAQETYKRLLQDDRTRFVGVRGILKQKLAEGETEVALKLAETAFALKPKHVETQDVLLKLQADKGDWTGARQTLNAKLRTGALPKDVYKRRDAVLALSEAKDILDEGNDIQAQEKAIEANRLSPDLIPAAVLAARGYIEADNKRYATRVLTKAWGARPHPDLAATFAEIQPDETPVERIKRFRALTKQNPDNPETHMLLAELHIAAEDFPEAKRALGDLLENDPTTRSMAIMAAIERGGGAHDAVVRGWLTSALSAPRGPQWVCDNCHNIHSNWAPVCSNCASFDTLAWKRPVSDEGALPSGAELLPLIVDAPKEQEIDLPEVIENIEIVDDEAAEIEADK